MSIEARILAELSEYEYASGEKISEKLNITRAAVWKHINRLRERGYDIKASPRNGYILSSRPDKLIAAELQNRLQTSVIGSSIQSFEEIGSTADKARELAMRGVQDGTVLAAESQTQGRGRMERGWVTPPGQAIALSVILYPGFTPPQVPLLGLAASLAVRQAVESVTGLAPKLKWPNDIYLGGGKVAGILVEMSAELDRVKWVVVSAGINVNNRFDGTPLEGVARSLREAAGGRVSRLDVAVAFLAELDRYYIRGLSGKAAEAIRFDFEANDMLQGREVEVQTPTGPVRGVASGIDADGRLLVRAADGSLSALFSGEASLARSG
ncbi:MAG: biotin--[acetyl-CoA-carboxylase] ligase [Gaiellales bacterium]|nr:MAG: biotin--[acetyl-CoA-carboxylase] ligase [Gaiellales bacterium]